MDTCPCGSALAYSECCGPIIKGERSAETAEQVMRARYSAYAVKELDYLLTSLHPGHRSDYDAKSTRAWAERAQWHKLDILEKSGGGPEDKEGKVEFVATYTEGGIKRDHSEVASFEKDDGTWYFVSGEAVPPKQVIRTNPKIGRNDPCTCGSGKKYKKCCGK
ncbi:MAG TPA: YchJ family protein [Dissulfurispiraceae bacterium]|nr:YchJ family protein [Dissulfurispiraceae bacterium]